MHIKLQNKETKLDFKQFVYITIPQAVYEEMMYYVEKFDTECSGCGLIKEIVHQYDDGTQIEYAVTEIFLPAKQDNHSAGTEYDGEAVAEILTKCVQENKITDDTHLRFHWHSHVNMSVYHSGTDEDNYNEIKCGDFLVSVVANKSGDVLGSVHYYKPMRFDVDSIPVYIETGEELEKTNADRNIAKVKEYEKAKPVRTYNWRDGYPTGYGTTYDYSCDDCDYYNRGNATDADFERFIPHLHLLEGGGEFEYLGDNVIKDLTSDKHFEVFLDVMDNYDIQSFYAEQEYKESKNADTK